MTLIDDTNEESKLMAHRIIARLLKLDPSLLERAKKSLKRQEDKYGEVDFVKEWKSILYDGSLDEIRRTLTCRSERMYRLRISSPFNIMLIPPLDQEAYRRRKWRKAKRLVQRRYNRREMETGSTSSFTP